MKYSLTEEAFRKLICSIRDKINGHTHDEFVTKLDLNGRGYLTESDIEDELGQFITEDDLDAKGFVTEADLDLDDYTKIADFESLSEDVGNLRTEFDDHIADDVSHITDEERTAWNGKANPEDIPTKVSQLENDKGYLTDVPSEYVTEVELEAKKYAKQSSVEELSEWTHQAVDEIVDAVLKHREDSVIHITAEERTSWNGKANQTDFDDLSEWTHQAVDEIVDFVSERDKIDKTEDAFNLISSDTLAWNGDTSGKVIVSNPSYSESLAFVRVSDAIPTLADFQNGFSLAWDSGDAYDCTASDVLESGNYIRVDYNSAFVIKEDNTIYTEGDAILTFPKKGIYLANYLTDGYKDFVSKIKINNYTGFITPVLRFESLAEHGHDWYGKTINKGNTVRSDDIVYGGFVKVSDAVPTLAEVQKGGMLRFYNVENGVITGDVIIANYLESPYGVYSANGQILIASDGITMVQIKADGVYFRQDQYDCVHSLTINEYEGFNYNFEKIPAELLPADSLKQIIREVIEEIIGDDTDSLRDINDDELYDALNRKLITKE